MNNQINSFFQRKNVKRGSRYLSQ